MDLESSGSNNQVVSVRQTGLVIASSPGTAILTARVGRAIQTVPVTVIEGEPFGGKKTRDSTREDQPGSTQERDLIETHQTGALKNHASRTRPGNLRLTNRGAIRPLLPIRPPNEDPLPDGETGSLYEPINNVGSPPGRTRPGATTGATATGGTETGNKNFTFALPIASLPGRGIDLSLSLVYNSLVFNKSTSGSSTYMTYDVDSGWPAPGFRIGYGQIENQGSAGFTLTDGDGTRHALVYAGTTNNYKSTDGTFLHFVGGSGDWHMPHRTTRFLKPGAMAPCARHHSTGVCSPPKSS